MIEIEEARIRCIEMATKVVIERMKEGRIGSWDGKTATRNIIFSADDLLHYVETGVNRLKNE